MNDPVGPAAILLDGGCLSPQVLGGKGSSLDQLVGWGLPVPPSGAVTTAAYRSFASSPRIAHLVGAIRGGREASIEEVEAVFAAESFDPVVEAEVLEVAARVGAGGRLAVRSSATVEDLAGSSFAGQYRSVLDVDPRDETAVLDAVRSVFASLWFPSPCSYRQTLGVDEDGIAMAVVMMRMVPAERAGVVFTTDPLTPGTSRVEVVDGLGEDLVSGARTPEVFVVPYGSDEQLPRDVRAALDASLLVEEVSGYPNDVEWAWDHGRLWVVQARPITVSEEGDGFDSPMSDDDLTTAGIAEMLPGVLPPLRWEIASHLVEQAFRRLFDDLTGSSAWVDPDPPLLRRVHGRAALDFSLMTKMTDTFSPEAASQLESRYFGTEVAGSVPAAPVRPSLIGRLAAVVRHLRQSRRVASARRRYVLDADIAIEAVARMSANPPESVGSSPRQLLARRLELIDLADRVATAQMGVAAEASAAFDRVVSMLIPDLDSETAERFARSVTSAEGVRSAVSSDASAAVFAGPTWSELEREPVAPQPRGGDRERADLVEALSGSPKWSGDGMRPWLRQRALMHAIDDAVAQLRRRESAKAALLWIGGHVRSIHLELGRHLSAAGLLDSPEEIELLSNPELAESVGGTVPPAAVLRRRRRWLERAVERPPLPTRFAGEPVYPEPAGGERLEGWAASPGVYRGMAVPMKDATDPFPDGSVLVAAATDASWAPLFARAGAIVVERGGPLSHASILARELGVPAVVNATGAMDILGGSPVIVNGDSGVVLVAETASDAR
jgi:pyruvate,water dikinase